LHKIRIVLQHFLMFVF